MTERRPTGKRQDEALEAGEAPKETAPKPAAKPAAKKASKTSLKAGADARGAVAKPTPKEGKPAPAKRRRAAATKTSKTSKQPATPGWDAASRAADLTLFLPGGVPMYFRLIPATTGRGFLMGEERGEQNRAEPRHWVRITRPFYLGVFPVTQGQYRAVAGHLGLDANPSEFKKPDRNDPLDHPDLRPVEQVSWLDATAWCDWIEKNQGSSDLSWAPSRAGKPPFERISLPTEAQWEYACRAGSDTEYCSGDGEGALEKVGWYGKNSGDSTRAVGRKEPNAFNLYDMHGNVWEWCRDARDEAAYRREWRYDGVADPEVTEKMVGEAEPDRLVRGGSWLDWARDCRSAIRRGWWPGDRIRNLGFRVCLVPGP